MHYKKSWLVAHRFASVAALGLLVCANGLMAQGRQPACRAADLNGAYATLPQGLILGGSLAGPFIAAGVLRFDGVGRFAGTASSSFGGFILNPFPAAGSYTVSPDCFIHVHEEILGIVFEGYFSHDKNEVVFFQPQPGTITTNVLRRLQIPACSARNLKDNWTIQATGSIFSSPGVLERQFAQNGRLNFDGRNSFTGKTSSTGVGGTIVDHNVTGTYIVNPDCTGSASLVGSDTKTRKIDFVLVSPGGPNANNATLALAFTFSDPGVVGAGLAQQQ